MIFFTVNIQYMFQNLFYICSMYSWLCINNFLDQRIDDIKYWKKELDDKLNELSTEIDSLIAFKARVEKALEATAEPLHIARQCLANRLE